jgi:hypothetical protein
VIFHVEWLPHAVDELAAVWIQTDSTGRRAITEATNIIDKTLRDDPFGSSESREDEDRVFFVFPLGVMFKVDLDTRIVRVEQVWQYRRPSK